MKLLRIGAPGAERPALLDDTGTLRDLGAHIDDLAGDALSPASLSRLAALDPATLPALDPDRIGPCVGRVGKLIGIGLNYSDHAAESGMPVPSEPIVFLKATSAICGPTDTVLIPRGSHKTDWEVELGIVIGTAASYIEEADALYHVAGYCVVNDISERAHQTERGGQWTKGKSADTFAPLGPWLVTRDAVPDCQSLGMWLDVDGQRRQTGQTATMVFGVAQIVAYLSGFMTLHPGDVIATGTPPGVGMGMTPPTYLRAGQTMRLGIEGLGEQVLPVGQA